jgi:TolB-like protein/Flp pilus assembly protein TadD
LWGRKSEAEKLLQELQDRDRDEYILSSDFARVYAALGNKDEALTWLEKAHQEREWYMILLRVSPWWDSAAKPMDAAQEPIEKIAVLPFTSISSEAGEEWFVDGMTDALITQLGKIKALTVISRTSAMQYKNVSKPMRDVARELEVDALVENDVQITARLIDGRRDERVWGDFFQGTFSNILALQSQVTLAIAREIEAALTPEEKRRITRTEAVNPEAYEAYLRGIFFFEKFTEESFKTATDYFNQAIEIEPDYAEAYAWLADAYWIPSLWGYATPHESFAKAKTAVNTAIRLDKTCAEAHETVGWIALNYDWDWQKAKLSFERAIELNPNYRYGYVGLAWYMAMAGRFDEAIDMMQTAVKLDPLSNTLNNGLANMYRFSEQVERAIEQRKKTLELAPGYVEAMDGLAVDYLSMSMYPEAIATIEKAMSIAGRTPELVTILARAYALSGRKDEAETLLQELHERAASEYVLPIYFAGIYTSLGNKDEAFRWLGRAYQERNSGMAYLRTWPLWDPLRSDPRFDDLVQRMGFPE